VSHSLPDGLIPPPVAATIAAAATAEGQPITALVCTRDRGASVERTVRSLLRSDHPNFAILVVDQSDDDRTRASLRPLLDSPRLRYVRTDTRGLSRARNLGLRLSDTEIVAMTDDDCEAPPDWLRHMAALFAAHPRVAVAFCNVAPAPHDARVGFVPSYVRRRDAHVRRIPDKCRARGMGAGMAVRRATVLALGGFDELLGPGAHFPSCEEGDLVVRAILGGHEVYETAGVAVVHHGFRTYQEGRELTRRDWLGIGAAYAKPLKCGRWSFAVVPLYEVWSFAALPVLRSALRLRPPRGVGRLVAFARGFSQGLLVPVDRTSLLYRPRPDSPSPVGAG
jgi:GT2 family glycosyltransferase